MSNLNSILNSVGIPVTEEIKIPGRPAVIQPQPQGLAGPVADRLAQVYPEGLYSHQSNALKAFLDGNDVCMATSTASGKSLVFTAAACHLAISDRRALIIAMYPARALVQDQLEKWQSFCEPLGVSVGQIDGSVAVAQRSGILDASNIVVMTPDVVHTWLMNYAGQNTSQMARLRLVILDEAHSYNGVFGTNMAYLFRRLSVLSSSFRLILSTATIGDPEGFVRDLTGRNPVLFRREDEGSQVPDKRVILSRVGAKGSFDTLASLLRKLADSYDGRFLAFADSRKVVERLTAAAHRNPNPVNAGGSIAEDEPEIGIPGILMPYRAGYEAKDRLEIQQALTDGSLKGVVSTSALELGVDIGDIDLVILLNTPPSVQAFWQRFGRAGRRARPGECVLLDNTGTIAAEPGGLSAYLSKPAERNYLYLGNRYVQFTNALCAARELQDGGGDFEKWRTFNGLPSTFLPMVENELNPTQVIPDDLYPLKTRAENGPHFEFPLRGGMEPNFQVKLLGSGIELGTLTMAQLVREAYPGAIYYYKANAYRIRETRMKERSLGAIREKFGTTQPNAQITVFPNFSAGGKRWASDDGFMQECDVQVAERVTGFMEIRGSVSTPHTYGVGSPWAQRPLQRFFKTTGVLWSFGNNGGIPEAATRYIVDAFCLTEGIHSRDIGFGRFSSNISPQGPGQCMGLCIYDDVAGGLRLTERLADSFSNVLETAIIMADNEADTAAAVGLRDLAQKAAGLKASASTVIGDAATLDEGWITVIAPGERAIHHTSAETVEVEILRYVPAATGLKYRLKHLKDTVKWTVEASSVSPIHGQTRLLRYHLETGEEEEMAS
jgi:DEAD/DEAH box helicase domain-containing protein